MERKVSKISPVYQPLPKLKRVAAYARVSSGKDAMLHSLSAQVSHYSGFIQKHPGWSYVGTYADEALTGTKDSRAEFQRLLADCRAELIDMVITKSISRFARNTVTLLETIRELKSLNINVYFERENIDSMSGDGELMLTILASFSQEESRSVSDNCKWRIQNRMKQGETHYISLYGYRFHNGCLEIIPDEAVVVRYIFDCYLDGMGKNAIAKKLNKDGYVNRKGNPWNENSVKDILINEKYAGDLLLQKSHVLSHIEKKKRRNHGELPMYFIENCHEAIIGKETYEKVKAEMQRRSMITEKTGAKFMYAFTGKIICGICGKNYQRKINGAGTKYARAVWICPTFNRMGKEACPSKQVPEDVLFNEAAEVLGLSQFDEAVFTQKIKKISIPNPGILIFNFNTGQDLERHWAYK